MPAGKRIGGYTLLRELARGGMGVVFEARAPDGERVALKLVLDPWADAEAVTRFLREAQAAARVRHPNVVRVLDHGDDRGRPFLVMEFLDGPSLKNRLDLEGPLQPLEAARLVAAVARGVAESHARGVLHRDLKPANVIQLGERPVLTDFGLARDAATEKERLTRTGQIMGSPGYMSPEQAGGEVRAMNQRCDVYGLGATLYALLTGKPPFKGKSAISTLCMVLQDAPVPPSKLAPGISPGLEAICLRCLEKDPNLRFSSAGDLADALEDAAASHHGGPSPRAALFTGAGLALIVLAGLALALGTRPTGDPSRAEPTDPTPAADAPSAAAAFAEGTTHQEAGRPQEAERSFSRALELDPNLGRAWFARGQLRADRARRFPPSPQDLAQLAAAEGDLKRAVELLPADPEPAWLLGWTVKLQGRHHEQRELLERLLLHTPTHGATVWQLVELRAAQGDLAGAIALGERTLESLPSHDDHRDRIRATVEILRRVREGRAHLDALRWPEAGEVVSRLREFEHPMLGRYALTLAHRLHGHIYYRDCLYQPKRPVLAQAEQDLAKAVELDERDADARALLALVRSSLSHPDWREDVRAALDLGRGRSALALLADAQRIAWELGSATRTEFFRLYPEQLERCRQAVTLAPRSVLAQFLLVSALSQEVGRYPSLKAVLTLEEAALRAMKQAGEDPLLLERLAWAYKEHAKLDPQNKRTLLEKAIKLHDEVRKKEPNFLKSYIERGWAKALLGDVAGFKRDLDDALKIAPEAGNLWWMRSVYFRDHGTSDELIDALRTTLQFAPFHIDAHVLLAQIERSTHPRRAVDRLRRAARQAPAGLRGVEHLDALANQIESEIPR